MTANLCGCTRPTRDGYTICDTCQSDLEQNLAEMRWLDEQLDISLTRVKGINYQIGNEPRSNEKPLPWNDRASRARHELKNELVGWVRIMVDGDWPADNLTSIAAWLMCRLNDIAKREDAWLIREGVDLATSAAKDAIDITPPRRYVGPCEGAIEDDGEEIVEVECPGSIFLNEITNSAECAKCRRAYDPIAAIKARNQRLAQDGKMLTLAEAAEVTHRAFGQPEARVLNTLKSWQKPRNGRSPIIQPAGHVEGVAIYRYQDLLDRLTRTYGDAS